MKKKNSLVKILVICGFICAAAVAIAAIIARMQNKISSSCECDTDDDDEGCTGNCCDCSFCEPEDAEDESEEEECEETETLSETAPAEEDK